jgi:hypothetical protein
MRLDPETLLTNLIGELSDMRGRVTTLEEQDLPATLDGLKATLTGIVEAVEKLQPVDEDSADGPGTAPDWTQVDQEEARELWEWLLKWCGGVLYPMYGSPVWRPCWYRHPQLRVELTWLCAYWFWAYEKTAPPTRAAEWHSRWWPHVKKVMQEELAQCGHDAGDPDRVMKHAVPPEQSENDFVDSQEQLDAVVEAHIARRPAPEKKKDKRD